MRIRQCALTTGAVLLAACASSGGNKPSMSHALAATTAQPGRECIYTNDIQGYGLRGNNVVTVDAHFGYYLLTFRPGCLDMATSAAAVFGNNAYPICGGLSDQIKMGDSTCTIDKIFKFANRQAAFDAYDTAAKMRAEASEQSASDKNKH
jgi:hypothetical protein